MKKSLLVLGKLLIAFSLMWPIPLGFIVFLPHCYSLNDIMWGEDVPYTYGWPLLALMALGLILCIIVSSRYKPAEELCLFRWKQTPVRWLFIAIWYSLIGIAVFFGLTLIVLAIYYLIFSKYATTLIPIVAGVIIFGVLVFFGIKYYIDYNKHNNP